MSPVAPVTRVTRVTYRSVLANREFLALLVSQTLSTLGDQLARIAVAVLVFQRTGSAFAASATYAVSYFVYLLGGPALSALSDRYPRLTVMVVADLLRAPTVLLLCIPGISLWAVFCFLALTGLLAPPFDSARSGVQPDLLQGDAYVVGNALINIVLQLGQVAGFIIGGALVTLVSVRGALVLDAASYLVSAGVLLACLSHRPAAQLSEERTSLLRDTASGISLVRRTPELRRYLAFSILASAALITPQGLAVPTAHALDSGPFAAGLLTAAVPTGFVIGSIWILRLPPARRIALMFPLALLCTVPLLLTPLAGTLPATATLWVIAGLGGALNLVAGASYVQACPAAFRSRAYGVAITLLAGAQGCALLFSGAVAGYLTPTGAVASTAAVMLFLTLLLPSLRRNPTSVP